jgi:hypothetical protein
MDRVFLKAWDEMNSVLAGRVPHLCVGFSFGGRLGCLACDTLGLVGADPPPHLTNRVLFGQDKPWPEFITPA